MPLWRIYHPTDAFTETGERKALSEAITAIYQAVPLPAFYVVVTFVPLPPDSIFVGGETQASATKPTFVRIVVSHLARTYPPGDRQRRIDSMNRFDQVLKPFIADKGWEYEIHVEETDRDLWRIQGKIPPPPQSEAEKLWIRENKPVDWDGAHVASSTS